MGTIIQIDQPASETRAFDPREAAASRSNLRVSRITRQSPATSSCQLDRIDAMKILIRSLLDQLDYLTEPGAADAPDLCLQTLVRRFEAEIIRQALIRTGGRQRQAARLLGEKKTTLNAKIMRYGIRVETPGQVWSALAERSSDGALDHQRAPLRLSKAVSPSRKVGTLPPHSK